MTYSTTNTADTITITGTGSYSGAGVIGTLSFNVIGSGNTVLAFVKTGSPMTQIIEESTNLDLLVPANLTDGSYNVVTGATISLNPTISNQESGQTFTVTMPINTNGILTQSANAVITYNSSILSISSYTLGSLYSGCNVNNTPGSLTIDTCTGAYNGTGDLISILFRADAVGSSNVLFNQGSTQILDSVSGTNLIDNYIDAQYTVYDATTSVADINNDGNVTLTDFALYYSDYINCRDNGICDARSDLNGDSTVNLADFSVYYGEYMRLR